MRLLFINPVSLPCMTESYLRKDFHFGMYLGYCYGKVLTRFFSLSILALLLLFASISTIHIALDSVASATLLMYLAFSGLFIALLILILLKSCLASTERAVVPSV
jgi:hypothetical protein